MRRTRILTLIAVLFGAILISGCTGTAAPTPTPEPVVENVPDPTEVVPVEDESVDEAPGPVPTQPAVPTPTPEPPQIKTGLEASDPSTVNLASGKPTLVEFFAFW